MGRDKVRSAEVVATPSQVRLKPDGIFGLDIPASVDVTRFAAVFGPGELSGRGFNYRCQN